MLITKTTQKIFYRPHDFKQYIIVPLIIRKQVEQILESHYPSMGGGFFFGDLKDQYRIIKKIWPIKNSCIKDHRRNFSFDNTDFLKAKHFAQEWKMDLIGLFHSNPNCRALPSLKDLEISVPGLSLVIISLQNGVIQDWTSWQLNQKSNSFLEEKVIL